MSRFSRRLALSVFTAATLALSPLAISHLDDKEVPQSYRQSYFAMIGANFGPMVTMLKGEIPWDEGSMAAYADQLAALATLDITRGFAPGSDKGTTRAKPTIWENEADFQKKLKAFRAAADELQVAANGSDRKAIASGIAATGKSCKGCHDEYKSKNYLY